MDVFAGPDFRSAAYMADGRMLVACQASNKVFVASADGVLSNECLSADFQKPQCVATDGDTIYVVDRFNHCVKVFSDMKFLKVLNHDTPLKEPVGIAVHPTTHNIYVADNENHRVVVFNPIGTLLQVIPNLYCPCGLALYQNLVIVAEWGSGQVQVFNAEGKSLLVLKGIQHAHAVTCDSSGNVYVAQYSHKLICKFQIKVDDDGTPSFLVSGDKSPVAEAPCGLVVSPKGVVVVVTASKLLVI